MVPLEVDLFASRPTHQLPHFFSWRLIYPAAEATDAFTQNGTQLGGFVNPPWCLILPTLAKIQREGQDCSGSTFLEESTMVFSPAATFERNSTDDSNPRKHGDIINSAGIHDAFRSPSTSRLAVIRRSCRSESLSADASRLLEASWRSKITSTYESLFKRCDSWCKERG